VLLTITRLADLLPAVNSDARPDGVTAIPVAYCHLRSATAMQALSVSSGRGLLGASSTVATALTGSVRGKSTLPPPSLHSRNKRGRRERRNGSGMAPSLEIGWTKRTRISRVCSLRSRSTPAAPHPNSHRSGLAPLHSRHSRTKHTLNILSSCTLPEFTR
jgi:hypothetical protein